jgi:hypothetical protein
MNHLQQKSDEFARKLWLFCWPLVFLAAMLVVYECNPQWGDSTPSAASTSVASQPATQSIK